MKKTFIGAMVLIAAVIMTGCGNNNQQNEEAKDQEATVTKPNRLLIIVDPQIDFTTGSLATVKGPEAMDRLAKAIEDGVLEKYSWVIVTQDAHPANHSSFIEFGGKFPPHCVQGTEGMNVYPNLQKVLDANKDNVNIKYLTKGDLAGQEEYSVFQNEKSGQELRKLIEETEKFEGIDICGIATDYCVFETVKDLIEFYPAKQVRIITNCIAAVDENDLKLFLLMKENDMEEINY